MALLKPAPQKNFRLEELFDSLYLFILLGVVLFGGYVFFVAPENHTPELMIKYAYFLVPIFVFSVVGLLKIRSDNSLLYAAIWFVVSVIATILFFEFAYPMLVTTL
jgi:hypothetical protein